MGGVMLSGCVLAAALAAGGKAPADGGRSVIADRPHVFSMSCKVPSCNKELNTAEGVARAKVDLEVSRGGRVVASARDAGPQGGVIDRKKIAIIISNKLVKAKKGRHAR